VKAPVSIVVTYDLARELRPRRLHLVYLNAADAYLTLGLAETR